MTGSTITFPLPGPLENLLQYCLKYSCIICVYYRRVNDEFGSKDREVKSLRRQLDNVREELTEITRDRDACLRENRRLQEDLATMTRENQVIINNFNPGEYILESFVVLCQQLQPQCPINDLLLEFMEGQRRKLLLMGQNANFLPVNTFDF